MFPTFQDNSDLYLFQCPLHEQVCAIRSAPFKLFSFTQYISADNTIYSNDMKRVCHVEEWKTELQTVSGEALCHLVLSHITEQY